MSLKDFVSEPDVKARLKAEFHTPALAAKPSLGAPPLTKNHSLVGTAFDYLLRFYFERLNPAARTGKWVAEEVAFDEVGVGEKLISLEDIVTNAKGHYKDYLQSGTVTDKLLASTLELAQLDVLYRRGEVFFDDSYFEKLRQIDPLDLADLRQLLALVNPEHVRAAHICLLNPTFGSASELVGGADCDLVIDSTLIDIKTTKRLAIDRQYFDQLLGYFFLTKLGQLKDAPPGHSITHIGIYFSRFGHLWTFDLARALDQTKLNGLITWFRERAKQFSTTA